MGLRIRPPPRRSKRWPTAVPDDAAHIVCVAREFVAPDGEGGQRRYTVGEEIPFEAGADALPSNPRKLMALDEDGEYVAGAVGHPHHDIRRLIATWEDDDWRR